MFGSTTCINKFIIRLFKFLINCDVELSRIGQQVANDICTIVTLNRNVLEYSCRIISLVVSSLPFKCNICQSLFTTSISHKQVVQSQIFKCFIRSILIVVHVNRQILTGNLVHQECYFRSFARYFVIISIKCCVNVTYSNFTVCNHNTRLSCSFHIFGI